MKYKLLKDIGYLLAGSVIQIEDAMKGFFSVSDTTKDQELLINHLFYNHLDEYFVQVKPPKPKSVWDLQPQDECYCIALGIVDKCTWLGTQQDEMFRDSASVYLTVSEAEGRLNGRKMNAQASKIRHGVTQ